MGRRRKTRKEKIRSQERRAKREERLRQAFAARPRTFVIAGALSEDSPETQVIVLHKVWTRHLMVQTRDGRKRRVMDTEVVREHPLEVLAEQAEEPEI